MNEELNLVEVLKNCPKGTRLYSPMYGTVCLHKVREDSEWPIRIESEENICYFTAQGKFSMSDESECMLFPSKDNRDWNTFVVKRKESMYDFKPFDKVLVRDDNEERWIAAWFSNKYFEHDNIYYQCTGGSVWKYCIPYEGNENLVGTMRDTSIHE